MLNKIKQKKCSKCKYNFRRENLNYCSKPLYGLEVLSPLKLFCFRKKKD